MMLALATVNGASASVSTFSTPAGACFGIGAPGSCGGAAGAGGCAGAAACAKAGAAIASDAAATVVRMRITCSSHATRSARRAPRRSRRPGRGRG
ncbi:MAG: hypothetical protein EBU70_09740 [Actinobacteria bacterium]|nr:hypothetical protein [Actinomycetota bacterium]